MERSQQLDIAAINPSAPPNVTLAQTVYDTSKVQQSQNLANDRNSQNAAKADESDKGITPKRPPSESETQAFVKGTAQELMAAQNRAFI